MVEPPRSCSSWRKTDPIRVYVSVPELTPLPCMPVSARTSNCRNNPGEQPGQSGAQFEVRAETGMHGRGVELRDADVHADGIGLRQEEQLLGVPPLPALIRLPNVTLRRVITLQTDINALKDCSSSRRRTLACEDSAAAFLAA